MTIQYVKYVILIDPGTAPNAEQARMLLESLRATGEGPHGPGTFLSEDMLIGAGPETVPAAKKVDMSKIFIPDEVRVVRVDWVEGADGAEHRWSFAAEPWKGKAGLVQRVRKALKRIASGLGRNRAVSAADVLAEAGYSPEVIREGLAYADSIGWSDEDERGALALARIIYDDDELERSPKAPWELGLLIWGIT